MHTAIAEDQPCIAQQKAHSLCTPSSPSLPAATLTIRASLPQDFARPSPPAAGAAEASDPEPSVLELPELKPPFRPAVVRPLLLGLLLLVLALEAEAERGDVLARYCA
eukprot:1143698-Pelagomonas_calceolata.AAC.3